MTVQRRHGTDSPFGAWVRSKKELDSNEDKAALVVNDIDWAFHKYKTDVDGIGTRGVQCCMDVEVKTKGAEPNRSQQEVWFFRHQLLNHKKKLRRPREEPVMVWNFGVFVLQLQGEYPRDGDQMRWGVFQKDGGLKWYTTYREKRIVELLGFALRPDRPHEEVSLRRHHKTRKLIVERQAELGFAFEEEVTFRS
jgi:hypothetical protein